MKNTSKIFSLMLVLAMVLGIALAVSGAETRESKSGEMTFTVTADLPSNDDLFAGYVNSVMYPEDPNTAQPQGTVARERLNDGEKAIYDLMRDMIQNVAAGELSSTKITMTDSYMDQNDIARIYWTTNPTEAYNSFFGNYNWHNVIYALTTDLPYDLYWFEKTIGVSCRYYYNYTSTYISFAKFEFSFFVSLDYKKNAGDDFTVDTSKTGAATKSFENAQAIVAQYASLDDYNKLFSYDAKIRELVDYNHDAWANGAQQMPYGDPWQLIWVFDNDPSTKVVCEGYAKAFHLLCDLSSFENDIVCINVSGDAGGAHMWNIVQMEDGNNYLVDVTWNDSSPGRYFLKGGVGSVTGGYTTVGSYRTYRSDMYDRFGTDSQSMLTLSNTDYIYNTTPEIPDNAIDSGKCGDNLTWTLYNDGELVIEGTGEMWDYEIGGLAPWRDYASSLKKLTIKEGVTYIGKKAFYSCGKFEGDLVIPNSVKTIGESAFYYCDGFKGKLIIGEGVIDIKTSAFYLCNGLTGDLVIPDSVVSIGSSAFYSCSNLDGSLTLGNNVTSIGPEAFYGCRNLTGDLIIPDSVTSLGANAFMACRSLNGILTIGAGVTEIKSNTFQGCDNIAGNLIIPEGVTSIGSSAFMSCNGLTEITLPKSMNSVDNFAFMHCTSLEKIVILSRDTTFGSTIFNNTHSNFTIHGYAGSTAEAYATANGHKFVALDAETPATYALTGTLTSYLTSTDTVTISLYAPDTTEAVYIITLAGDATEYKFDAVAPGTYTMVVEKKNHVTREYDIVVEDADAVQDVKICPIGDVTGDGKTNAKDWQRIYLHVNKTDLLTGYELACGDVTRDGKTNAKDWQRVYLHVNKTDPLW